MNHKRTTWAATALVIATAPLLGQTVASAAPQQAAAANQATSAKELAQQIQADNGISLLASHVGGQNDSASTARQNIEDTAKGNAAHTSPWSDVGVTKVTLDDDMLAGMVKLGKKFDYQVTTIAGGDHSSNSNHYAGTAVDIGRIDGAAVSANNPKVATLRSACADLGAVEILGPGDAGHDTHVHCAWQR